MVRKRGFRRIGGEADVRTGVTVWENFLGVNLVADNTNMKKQQVAWATNADFSKKPGAISKTPGADSLGSITPPIKGGAIVSVDDKQYMLVANTTDIYKLEGGRRNYFITTETQWDTGTLYHLLSNSDGTISIDPAQTSGTWTSPSYYLGNYPYEVKFTYMATIPAGCTLAVKYQTSANGSSWSSEYTLDTDGIPVYTDLYIRFIIYMTTYHASFKVSWCRTYTRTEFENPTSIYSALSGNDVYFENYKNRVFIAHGGRPLVWDGSTVRNAGVDKPSTSPTCVSGTSGSPNGVYKCSVTYVNTDDVESEPCTQTTVTVSSQKIEWSSIPVGPTGTAKRRLYRSIAAGSTLYKVYEVPDNTTTTYSDNNADTVVQTGDLCPDDNQVPPNASFLKLHLSYMFYIDAEDDKKLWFSKPAAPENVPNKTGRMFYFELPSGVRNVASNVNLIVSGMGYMKCMTGTIFHTDVSITDVEVTSVLDQGAVSARASCLINPQRGPISVAMLLENRDVGILGPTMMENIFSLPAISANIAPVLYDSTEWEGSTIYSFNNKVYLGYSTGVASLPERVVLVFDINTREWQGIVDAPVRLFLSTPWRLYGLTDDGTLLRFLTEEDVLFWGKKWGTYWEYLPVTVDSTNVDFVVDTGYKSPSGATRVRYRYVQLIVSGDSITDSLNVTVVVDGLEDTVAVGAKDTWNVASETGGQYGLGRQDAVLSPPFALNVPPGRFAGVRLSDTSDHPLTVYAVILSYEHTPVCRGGI